jgi:ribosomal protein S18 acetylase RimI-like enzyme
VDGNAAASVLARAFDPDPFYRWMLPDDDTRLAALTAYFLGKLAAPAADVVVSGSGHTVLVTIDLPSGSESGAGLGVLARFVDGRHRMRIADVLAAVERLHPRIPHTYIDVIATDPLARGRGEGTVVLREWLAAHNGRPLHLQSSNERNLSFYRRLGFVAAPAVDLPHGAGRLTPMNR